MIFLELFLAFLKVGCFSFGGAYFAIPLIRETVLSPAVRPPRAAAAP